MDLNELLYQQQRAIAAIARAAAPVFGSRFDLVSHYDRRIRRLQDTLGAVPRPTWLTAGAQA